MAEKHEYREFKELLKKGIGKKTQKEFSKDTGVSYEHINRMINQPLIFQPSVETLRKLSRGMSTVMFSELMESCGYPAVSVEDEVAYWEGLLISGYAQLAGSWYDNPEAFFQTMRVMYMEEGSFSTMSTKEADDEGVDFFTDSFFCRQDAKNLYYTKCRFSYCESKKGKVIPVGFQLVGYEPARMEAEDKVIVHTLVRKKSPVSVFDRSKDPKRFMQIIFGDDEKEYELITGYGLHGMADWDNFTKFLANHADAFCKIKEHSDIYRKVMECSALEEFYDKEDEWAIEDIIASIMSEETGDEYRFYYNPEHSYIMFPTDISRTVDDRLMETLLSYSRELGFEEFGACYYHEEVPKRTDQIYKTADYRPK